MRQWTIRIITSISFLFAIALLTLWIRSEFRGDWGYVTTSTSVWMAGSGKGGLRVVWDQNSLLVMALMQSGRSREWSTASPVAVEKLLIGASDVWGIGPRRNWHFPGFAFTETYIGVGTGFGGPPTITRSLYVWYGWLVALTAILPAWRALKWWKQRRIKPPGACKNCGYDLRATPDRCPECGTLHDCVTNRMYSYPHTPAQYSAPADAAQYPSCPASHIQSP